MKSHVPAVLLTVLMATAAVCATGPAASADTETKEHRDARMAWWREARFGMFVHWGLYSVPAGVYHGKQIGGEGEWIMNSASIPVAEYADYAKRFNPVKFDADQWVCIAKNAGMKYIVVTAKHHEGFAMFKSQVSPYNIVDATPFHRDPLKELAEACRRQGIKLGFYYSQAQDWHHPGGAWISSWTTRKSNRWDSAQEGGMDEYVHKIAAAQVRELLSNYGPIAVFWWDTPVGMTKEQIEALGSVLKLQPGIISNNRLGGDVPGDTETPEQFIPPSGYPGRDWETCMTMNDTWGYKSYDNNWKSSETLIRNLIDVASKGGNYLLNVGPTSEGLIPQPSVERLQRIGQVVENQRRGNLRHVGQPVQEPAGVGPRDPEAGQTLPARLRLAQERLASGAAGEQAREGVLAGRAGAVARMRVGRQRLDDQAAGGRSGPDCQRRRAGTWRSAAADRRRVGEDARQAISPLAEENRHSPSGSGTAPEGVRRRANVDRRAAAPNQAKLATATPLLDSEQFIHGKGGKPHGRSGRRHGAG